jgi:hypothetical protein
MLVLVLRKEWRDQQHTSKIQASRKEDSMNNDLRKHRWIVVVTASLVGLMVFACSLTGQKDTKTKGESPVATQSGGEPPVATQTEAAQVQSSPLKLISQLGGGVWAVDVQGQVAYVGVGPRLWVLDTSSSELKVLGQSEVLKSKVRGVEVRDNYAYLATEGYDEELVILDISDPVQPLRVSSLDAPSTARYLRLEGDLVYMATHTGL